MINSIFLCPSERMIRNQRGGVGKLVIFVSILKKTAKEFGIIGNIVRVKL